MVIRQLIGVCAAITPWSFLLAMIASKMVPALASGRLVVVNMIKVEAERSIAIGKVFCAS